MAHAEVWLDALTPKQAHIFAAMARRFLEEGFHVLLTVRDYDYSIGVARSWGIEPLVVGRYGGASLDSKLESDAERATKLAKLLSKKRICTAIMYPSPSGARVAYGLAIPLVILSDSPHSVYVHRLTLPLADFLVHSAFIPLNLFKRYLLNTYTKHLTFRGFDEVEYLGPYQPSQELIESLGLEPYGYIVVRPPEYKAAYYRGYRKPKIEEIVLRLAEEGYTVVYLPRYPEQKRLVESVKNVLVPNEPLPGADLVAYAKAVITGGASMAREAALLGTPAATLYRQKLAVDEAVKKLGAPLHYTPTDKELEEFVDNLLDGKISRRTPLANKLKRPSDTIVGIVADNC